MKFASTILAGLLAAASADAYLFTGWSGTGYSGSTVQASTGGVHKLGFKAASYKWSSGAGDGCCVKMCNGNSETGSWCPGHNNDNVAKSNRFNKVVIGCNDDALNC